MGNELEYLDIYDANLQHIGIAGRQEVHRKGYWHKTFHCWVLCERQNGPALILQQRHANKDTFPNKLDVSCAGHLLAGEGPEDGIRELREELGIHVSFPDLKFISEFHEEFRSGDLHDCEIAHVYLYRTSLALACFYPDISEVSGLYEVPARDMRSLILGHVDSVEACGFVEVDEHGRRDDRIQIRLQDIVERPVDYYAPLFETVTGLGQ